MSSEIAAVRLTGRDAPAAKAPFYQAYLAALSAAAAGFVAVTFLLVIWAFDQVVAAHLPPDLTRRSVLTIAVVAVGVVVMPIYALVLPLTRATLKIWSLGGRAAHAAVAALFGWLLLALPLTLMQPRLAGYFAVFVLPGAAIGGWVLGAFRPRTASPSPSAARPR